HASPERRGRPSMNDPHAPTSLESVQLADLADQVIVESSPAVAGSEAAEGFAGITPPRRRGGAARFISDVIVELGFLPQARVDPANVLAIDDLKLMTGYEIRPAVASAEDIAGLIAKMNRLDDAVAESLEDEDEDDQTLVADIRESATDAPVIKLVNSIIAQAVE